jgi:hypothetical protein
VLGGVRLSLGKQSRSLNFKTGLVYTVRSRAARATQRNPDLKNKKQNTKPKPKKKRLLSAFFLSLENSWPFQFASPLAKWKLYVYNNIFPL